MELTIYGHTMWQTKKVYVMATISTEEEQQVCYFDDQICFQVGNNDI